MLDEAQVAIILQSLNWLGSAERAEWLRDLQPNVYVLPNRPSFVDKVLRDEATGEEKVRKNTTDALVYGWYVFDPDGIVTDERGQIRMLDVTPAEERRRR